MSDAKSVRAKAEADVAVNPFDTEAWNLLILEAKEKPIEEARPVYERFLKIFPTSARHWVIYAEHELREKNLEQVEKLFLQCLMQCLNVELWRFYISYIKQTKGGLEDGRQRLVPAFEFALEHMGLDVNSTKLWTDYIDFLREQKCSNSQEEGQKMTAVRLVYQRAVQVPMHGVEQIWKDYEAFEQDLSKVLAQAFLKELGPKYMAARSSYRERRVFLDGLLRNALARPPPANARESKQLAVWRRLLAFEKTNPQKLEDEVLLRRVMFTYNQCLMCFRHYPDVWLEFTHYASGCKGLSLQQVRHLYERSVAACPQSRLLLFSWGEYEESTKNFKDATAVYERLLKTDDPLAYIQLMRATRRMEGVEAARKIFLRAHKSASCTYHIYIAAANLEFFVNKDPKGARNIFELGMKKYSAEPAFVMKYLDLLTHLNEDNNLRVVYERVLSSIPSEHSAAIWRRFLDFEYNCGDLVSIGSAQKRYFETLHVKKSEERDQPTLGARDRDREGRRRIDTANAASDAQADASQSVLSAVRRFRYLDLWPCNAAELQGVQRIADEVDPPRKSHQQEEEAKRGRDRDRPHDPRYPVPNLSGMIQYQPAARTGLNVPGLTVALPLSLIQFAERLPPAHAFVSVPPVNVDALIASLLAVDLPPSAIGSKFIKPQDAVEAEIRRVVAGVEPPAPSNGPPTLSGHKRTGHDSDDEDEGVFRGSRPPPAFGAAGAPDANAFDVFTRRQRQKLGQ